MSSNTTPLYAEDSHLKEFNAVVIKAGPRYVILDKTAFYPEGGGQPSDIGYLKFLDGNAKVVKVQRRGSEIYHYIDTNIPHNTLVHGVIDWAIRSWNMRRHSAEHLLTGLIDVLGEPPKVYSDLDRLEYSPSNLNDENIKLVELRFNEIVREDIPVRVYFVNREHISISDDPRKQSFLQKIPRSVDKLRMVDIGTYASTFCFGTHVKSTKEIGELVELQLEEAKKGRKIVHFKLKL